MRKTLLMSAALLGLAVGPVLAQNSTSSTMSPPAPNAGTGMPDATNSMPRGAGTGMNRGAGDAVGSTGMTPADRGMTGMRPMRGQERQGANPDYDGRPARGRSAASANPAMDAPSTGEYRGGAGSPRSNAASNTTAANTRSEIAPRLPDPGAADNTAQGYLVAAQRALASNRTGAAQEALERAETRLLSRSTDPSMASSPSDMPMIRQIGDARRAIAARDMSGARSAISAAMASGG